MDILAAIDDEISRLQQVRSLLAKSSGIESNISAKGKKHKKRKLSAEARKRIADAQRKRWAAQRAK